MLCPYCKEEIQDGAIRCKHCQATLGGPLNDAAQLIQGTPGSYDASKPFFDVENLKYMLLSPNGRLNRGKYWALIGVFFGVYLVAGMLSYMLWSLVALVAIYPSVVMGIKRFHDLNKSGWWMLACLIPIINLYAAFLLLCVRGTDGPNPYGEDLLAGNPATRPAN